MQNESLGEVRFGGLRAFFRSRSHNFTLAGDEVPETDKTHENIVDVLRVSLQSNAVVSTCFFILSRRHRVRFNRFQKSYRFW